MLRRAGEYDDHRALEDLEFYVSLSIDEALSSPSPLVRALAMIDRRLGKRRLSALASRTEEYRLVRELWLLRCEAEGLPIESPANER